MVSLHTDRPLIALPSGDQHIISVPLERIAESTLQAISALFPGERGLHLLALLLREASVKQLALPGVESELVDAAVIPLPNIEAFARKHGWSKDTVLRYLAILQSLNIAFRHRSRKGSELYLPLVGWEPTAEALSNLERLIAHAREKLAQLACSVKERFLLLFGTPESWASLTQDLHTTLGEVQQFLRSPKRAQSKRTLLSQRIERLKARLCQGDFLAMQPGTSLQKGDAPQVWSENQAPSAAHKGDVEMPSPHLQASQQTQKGDFLRAQQGKTVTLTAQKGDPVHSMASMVVPDQFQKGDFSQNQQGTSSPSAVQKGDFLQPSLLASVPAGVQKGDLLSGQGNTMGAQQTQKGDFLGVQGSTSRETFAPKGDFCAQRSAQETQKGDFQTSRTAASLNDNVSSIDIDSLEREDDSDNDGAVNGQVQASYSPGIAAKVGRKLALFLENSPRNTGGFVKKCKECSPTVIQAAVIDVLVHTAFPTVDVTDDRGRPRNKAKWFHDACNKYVKPGACIPAFVTKWLRNDLYWQDFDTYWQEVATHLDEAERRYKRYMITESGEATLVRQFLCGEIDQQALDEALQRIEASVQRTGHVPTAGSRQPEAQTPIANGKGVSVGSSAATKTWMDEYEAESLAEEIIHDEQARALGVSKAEVKPEHGVFLVMVTWKGATFPMKTAQAWRTHLAHVQHSMAVQREQALQRKQLRERGQ